MMGIDMKIKKIKIIEATVHDAITDEQIENAIVELKLTDDDTSAGNMIEEFSDQDGEQTISE
jgi:hypothetical protein